jgi:hypothetical protein
VITGAHHSRSQENQMKNTFAKLAPALAAVVFAGCVTHTETVYREVPRVKVEFETERAGRVFYEALSKMPHRNSHESHTEFSIPVVFEHKSDVKTGDSETFNEAVHQCDTNQDGIISEKEADIFAAQRK